VNIHDFEEMRDLKDSKARGALFDEYILVQEQYWKAYFPKNKSI
jgi:hypothetical protein